MRPGSLAELVHMALERNLVHDEYLSMALIEFPLTNTDQALHVDSFGLSIGDVSVGLPMSCTADTVLLRYLDLVRLCDRRDSGAGDIEAHLVVLADAVRLDAAAVRARLSQLAA